MEICLNNLEWELKGYWPWVPLRETSMETGKELMGVTGWIPATVPGGVHYDLYRAGWIEHPHGDLNSMKCEWVENRWWMYKAAFNRPADIGEKAELIFKGLDYQAMVHLNNICLGEHEGMYEPAVFDITGIIRQYETLELFVLFRHAPDEISQIGKTSLTHTQKSRFNYKWDFSTRMVNTGIWDDVVLRVHKTYSVADIFLHTDTKEKKGLIHLEVAVVCNRQAHNDSTKDLKLKVKCSSPDGEVAGQTEIQAMEGKHQFLLEIDEARLWYPNGYGGQPLYTVDICLADGEEIIDKRQMHVGIRKLEYVQNVGSPKDALPYTCVINGKKIYTRGVNMTPLDHLYGNVTASHYEWMITMMKRANVNMVRVWGGGIIEKEAFYRLCDLNGIMVWQEFIQSSSGIDNIPSKRPEFLNLLKKTAVSALKEKRNHVSLTVWSGGNELMSETNKPSTYEDENIAMLKALVEEYDPQRLFLPTSASGPVEFVTAEKELSHDVHGYWVYMGNPGHYELYRQSDSLFHSEFGVDGVSCVKSLKKFLSPQYLKPASMVDDFVWRHHGEWWDTLARDQSFFGPIEELAVLSDCSQWIQAEGLRFIVEANRRRQFRNSGSIIWQFNEPWPNVSCTNLVDYYGEAKMAYYWVRKAYAPVTASMDYSRLSYLVGETFTAGIYVCCNSQPVPVSVEARVTDIKGRLLFIQEYGGFGKEYEAVCLGDLCFDVTQEYKGLFFVQLDMRVDGISSMKNLYIFSTGNENIYQSALGLQKPELDITAEGDWHTDTGGFTAFRGQVKTKSYFVKNIGNTAALHIRPWETTNAYWMEADDSYFTLFPGEEAKVTVTCVGKDAGGFLAADRPGGAGPEGNPDIKFRSFGDRKV